MPKRKSRRTKSKPTITWRRLFIYFIPVFLGAVFIINQVNGGNVLGESDSSEKGKSLFNFGTQKTRHDSIQKSAPKPLCNRVTSFTASTICERSNKEKSNNAFKSYSYTCEDGTSGSLEQTQIVGKCLPIEKAYEMARKACNKKCLPPKSPTPTPEIQPQ